MESLINTCQELYHDRSKLLRPDTLRWNSFISFLNEMYGLLKRKQLHFLTKYEGVPPKLVLLSLLAECCTATLTSQIQSLAEVEILFVVLTHIGKDLETETPGRMSLLDTCLREALLSTPLHPQIGKTLLQLIELRAAQWNLPAQAVMYYYPGSSR
ncbi:MIF4G domain-containing protein [Eurytemora carolleeae]|uniref:MIF4G domain-containing protein n=1 Tax=Eurytemora carolleeae TaxID=1294199 RepID=UPI000C789D41|nr:MIF4G domain-containing protein [Eurytemora carolleeae]|eukprot:XP_023333309.1 MIF4G domain-containing protein-like [Eurytemora affinis]